MKFEEKIVLCYQPLFQFQILIKLLELRPVSGAMFLNKTHQQDRSGLCQTCITPSRRSLQKGRTDKIYFLKHY